MDEFKRERKIHRFKEFLKNRIFNIIFRDTQLMKAVDTSFEEKQ